MTLLRNPLQPRGANPLCAAIGDVLPDATNRGQKKPHLAVRLDRP
jgi:hypothetical protein